MEFNKIIIGAMRVNDAQSAVQVIRKAIDSGFNYIDTSPLYRLTSEEENSEAWIGQAINYSDYRGKVMLSTKCATSDGRMQLGEFQQQRGLGVRTAEQFSLVFNQSLRRMNVSAVDYYHLWICHTKEQFNEAFKSGGWYEGFLKVKKEGKVKRLGLTSHADAETIINFLESGCFETVTIPLNVLNRARIKVVEYCAEKNIRVLAMNPLGGGFLAADERLKQLAYKYLLSLQNVQLLVGFTTVDDVEYAVRIKDEFDASPSTTEDIVNEADKMIPAAEPRCTGCGYCQPCPTLIDIGACLSYYNLYKYLGLESAKTAFQRLQWNVRYNLNNCTSCGLCEEKCPNSLPVRDIINDAASIMLK